MAYETIELSVRDGVADLVLSRPQAANSINVELAKDLMDATLECEENPAVRVVVLRGSGAIFCGGGDLKTFDAKGDDLPRYLKEVTTYLHAAVSRLARMDPPVIAAVHGSAGGAGMSLVCAADIVLAGEKAKFTMAYTRAGLTPDGSSTYFLSRIVGLRRALELSLTNRVLSAAQAEALGIVTRVVPDAELLDEVRALALSLASGPTKVLGATKRLLHSGWTESLESQMDLEARVIADMARGADAREGIRAFIEKRAPRFTGR